MHGTNDELPSSQCLKQSLVKQIFSHYSVVGFVFVAELLAVVESVLTGIEQAVDYNAVGFVTGELQIH